MKTQAFSIVLATHAEALALLPERDVCQGMNELATLMEELGATGTVSALLKKLTKKLDEAPELVESDGDVGGIRVDDFDPHLEALRQTLLAAGAKAAAGDLEAVSRFLERFGSVPLRQAVSQIMEANAHTKATKSKSKPKNLIDATEVRALADKLTRANEAPNNFGPLLTEMKADKNLSKPLLEKVANQFLGIELKYKSKAEIFKKIEDRHYVDTLNNSRGRIIDRIAI